MPRRRLPALLLALALPALAIGAPADGLRAGSVTILHPWFRAAPPGAPAAAAYVTLVNRGARPERLLAASAPAAGQLEIHAMTLHNGIMSMRLATNGVEMAAHATVELKPGGFHLMLSEVKRPLRPGDRVPVTLVFERAGKVVVPFVVEAPGRPPARGTGAATERGK